MTFKSKFDPESFLSQPKRLRKYAVWFVVATLIVSLAAAACGWVVVATTNRYLLRAEPGYFYVQGMMFTFMFLAHVPGIYFLRKGDRSHIQKYVFAVSIVALVSLPVGCYALGKAFNHKTRDNFLDACIGSNFDVGGTAACRASVHALRAYIAVAYVFAWILQAATCIFCWYYYRHLANAFAEKAEEEEKAMLRPMSYASTRGSRHSYASSGGDPRASYHAGHRRSSSDPRASGDQRRASRHSASLSQSQNAYRQSILRNSVVADGAEYGQRHAVNANRTSVLGNRDSILGNRDSILGNRDSILVNRDPALLHRVSDLSTSDSILQAQRNTALNVDPSARHSPLAEDNQLAPGLVAFPYSDRMALAALGHRPSPPGLTPPGSDEYHDPYAPAAPPSQASDTSYGADRSALGLTHSSSGLEHSEGTGASYSNPPSGSEHAVTMQPAPSRQVSYSEGPAPGQAPSRRVSFSEEPQPALSKRVISFDLAGSVVPGRKAPFAHVRGSSSREEREPLAPDA
ncbi:hypothetical protein HDZ31DRAFT_45183 [Schizophyllum fasciatum]